MNGRIVIANDDDYIWWCYNVADYLYNNGLSFCLILLYLKVK